MVDHRTRIGTDPLVPFLQDPGTTRPVDPDPARTDRGPSATRHPSSDRSGRYDWPMRSPTAGHLFSDDPAALRRLALILYAVVTPIFCIVLALESADHYRLPAVAIAAGLCVGGGAWMAIRREMGTVDWIVTGAAVPIVCCGVAYIATDVDGPAYLMVIGAPIAWAAVLFEGPVVVAAVVLAVVTTLVTLTPTIGPLPAIANTVVFAAIFGLVAWVGYWKASTLRALRDEVLATNSRLQALMDALPDTITRGDPEGRFLELHAPADAPLPMPVADLIGRPVYEFLPVEAREPMRTAIATALETGEAQRIEYTIGYPDGGRRFETRIVRSGRDEIVAVRSDITERVRADEHARFTAGLVDTMEEAVTTVDLTGVVTSWSPGAERVYGWSAGEAVGRPLLTLLRPDLDADAAKSAVNLMLWEDTVRQTDERVRKDGRRITVEGWYRVIPGPDGEPSGILGVARDITALQAERNRVAASEALHRATVAALAEGLIVFDADGRAVTSNEAARDIMGLTTDQLMGEASPPPGWRAVASDGVTPVDTAEVVRRFAASGETQGVVGAFRHEDGELVWARVNSQVLTGAGGGPAGIVVTLVDITEERRVREHELAEARLESLATRMNDAELVMRLDGSIVHANDRALELYGYPREAIVGRNVGDFRAPDTGTTVEGQMAEAAQPGARFETIHRRSDGTEFPVEVSSRGFESGGERYLHSLVRDLSEIKRAEAQRLALEAAVAAALADRNLILASSPVGITRTRELVQVWTNTRMQQMFGYSEAEMAGLPTRRLFPDDEGYERLGREAYPILADGLPYVAELEMVRQGGSRFWARVAGRAVDPAAQPLEAIWTFEDITARRAAELRLADSERRYRTLFENMQEDITVYRIARDADGHPTDWVVAEANAEGRRWFGEAYESSIGKTTTELGYGDHMAPAVARSDEFTAGLVTAHQVVHFPLRDVYYLSAIFAIDPDTIVNAVIDISERIRAEADLRRALDENERTVVELRQALAEVRTLSGLLPICMYCKKIRNDEGYWDRIEQYLSEHTDAMLSHGLCPDCYRKYAQPDLEAAEAEEA